MPISLKNFYDSINYTKIISSVKNNSLGIKRDNMPQIFSENVEEFLNFLNQKNILHFQKIITPSCYRACQCEFNKDKIFKIINDDSLLDLRSDKTVFTSKDSYIIDGHHRWLAHMLLNDRQLKVIEIDLEANELLDVIRNFKHTEYKSIKEESINAL